MALVGISHVLCVRMQELRREPEVIFWVFVFPLLLALGLGIAFRDKPADRNLGCNRGRPAGAKMSTVHDSAFAGKLRIHADTQDDSEAADGFRLGKYDSGSRTKRRFSTVRSGATRERAGAHAEVDDALQTAAGRKDGWYYD